VEMPEEWVWRGPKAPSLESMYANRAAANDWNRTGQQH
jgi:hypothetical protein